MPDEKSWKPLDLVKVTAGYLGGKEIPNPRLDAELLLCEVLKLPRRVDLYAGFEREISGKELAAYREMVRRRSGREPVSRILGRREFMGLVFKVTPDVLSPRPETELLVETALEMVRPKKAPPPEAEDAGDEAFSEPEETPAEDVAAELERLLDSYAENVEDEEGLDEERPLPAARPAAPVPQPRRNAARAAAPARQAPSPAVRVLDLGTGSGCIAVAMAANLPGATVVAIDASPKALAVAKHNAAAAGVADRVEFRQGDWFAGCRNGETFDLILSNPPYLVEGDADIWPEVSGFDPVLALYAGRDGLDCYRRILPDAADWLTPDGTLLFEVGAGQADAVAGMARRRGFAEVDTIKDYSSVDRIVRARGSP